MIQWLKQMLLINAVLLPPMLLFPAICLTLAAHPDHLAAQLCFWFGPLSAGFWVLVYSQWSSAMAWQRMGRLHHWRSDHGGFAHTLPRACGWLFFGIVGSFAAEVIFAFAFRLVPGGTLKLWLTLFPFACYFPLFVTWAWRRRHA